MKKSHKIKLKSKLGLVIGLAGMSALSNAAMVEEMVVTSQIREESLQDVSASVQVTTGEQILDTGVKDLEALSLTLPAVNISKGGASDQMYVRGIGSGFNGGFEQAVGTYIDGVYIGRSRGTRSSFVDLERIEVLKGPQSLYFGNSSIAGALNISSASPDVGGELDGHFIVNNNFDFDETNFEGAVNLPVTDTFALRLAARDYSTDGYVKNTFLGEDAGASDDTFVRLGARWEPSDSFDIEYKFAYGESDSNGPFIKEIVNCPSTFSDRIKSTQTQFDPNSIVSGGPITCALQSNLIDNTLNYELQGEGSDSTESTFSQSTLNMNWHLNAVDVTSISAWVDNEQQEIQDLDSGPLPLFNTNQNDQVSQFSQELRFTSTSEGMFEWMTGLYVQTGKVSYEGNQMPNFVGPTGVSNGQLTGLTSGPLGSGRVLAQSLFGPEGSLAYTVLHEQQERTLSAFGELTWHLNDTNRLISGLRWIKVKKELLRDGDWMAYPNVLLEPGTSVVLQGYNAGLDGNGKPTFGDSNLTNETHADSWNDLLPSLIWEHDLNDSDMLYVSYAAGFKAGGFNFSGRAPAADVSFAEETVNAYEMGYKGLWFDSSLRVNASLFYSDYKNVQMSVLTPGGFDFTVGNAAATITKGAEFDLQYAATDNLTLNASITFLNSEFDDYVGECNVYQQGNLLNMLSLGQTGTFGRCTGTRIVDTSRSQGDRHIIQGSQDLSGHATTFAPDYSGYISAVYRMDVGSGLTLDIEPNLYFTDSYFIQQDFDPFTEQDGFTQLGMRIELSDMEGNWSLAVIGKNLSDEKTIFFANDLPGGGGSYVQSLNPPRSVSLQGRYNF